MTPDPFPARAIVLGGYGTFGQHVARELAERGVRVTVAGPDLKKATALAAALGPEHLALRVDVGDRESCLQALAGQTVAAHCAGSFSERGPALLEACLERGCHYVDIADDRRYAAVVRGFDRQLRSQGVTAVGGCSSLPAISTAAALLAKNGNHSPVTRVRCTLFIGNDNPKGSAAVRSAASLLGRSIEAPQGILRGFRDFETVELPEPFGRRSVLNFESPDYDLLPGLLGAPAVAVKVGFELRVVNVLFATLAATSPRLGRWLTPRLAPLGGCLRRLGCSGGAVMAELFFADGSFRSVALLARQQGQRMAALPAVYATQRLCGGDDAPRGAITANDLFGPEDLTQRLVDDGYHLVCNSGQDR